MNAANAALGLVSAVAVIACANGPDAAGVSPAAGVRVLVKLVSPAGDGAAIARAATAVAGVPVRYIAASSVHWHAVAVQCASAPQCEQAVQRLRAASDTFSAVEADVSRRATAP